MSTETRVKPGDIVTGRQANALPVGSQIRFHECNLDDPIWTKGEDTDYDPEWMTAGHSGWPIDEAARWVVVSIAAEETPMSTDPTFTVTTGRWGGICYLLAGPAAAIEWMGTPSLPGMRSPSVPDGLYHYGAPTHGETDDDACDCELLPSGRCWPGAGMLMGESETIYRSSDVARSEARMQEVYAEMLAEQEQHRAAAAAGGARSASTT